MQIVFRPKQGISQCKYMQQYTLFVFRGLARGKLVAFRLQQLMPLLDKTADFHSQLRDEKSPLDCFTDLKSVLYSP